MFYLKTSNNEQQQHQKTIMRKYVKYLTWQILVRVAITSFENNTVERNSYNVLTACVHTKLDRTQIRRCYFDTLKVTPKYK